MCSCNNTHAMYNTVVSTNQTERYRSGEHYILHSPDLNEQQNAQIGNIQE